MLPHINNIMQVVKAEKKKASSEQHKARIKLFSNFKKKGIKLVSQSHIQSQESRILSKLRDLLCLLSSKNNQIYNPASS